MILLQNVTLKNFRNKLRFSLEEMELDDSHEYDRKIVVFKDLGRFKLTERKYDDDSLNIYTARLNNLREETLRRAKLKWSKPRLCIQNLSTLVCYSTLCMLQLIIHM